MNSVFVAEIIELPVFSRQCAFCDSYLTPFLVGCVFFSTSGSSIFGALVSKLSRQRGRQQIYILTILDNRQDS